METRDLRVSVLRTGASQMRLSHIVLLQPWLVDYTTRHINEKHIERLHKDGLLSSIDFESFDMCESCLLGRITKAPFTSQSESVSDLLGLVYTDVCGPINSMARGGFQYFITFTDD
jgi:hypothetical protein